MSETNSTKSAPKVKLSKAQREVLTDFARGYTVAWVYDLVHDSGWHWQQLDKNSKRVGRPDFRTLKALKRRGLVELDGEGGLWSITEQGRAALGVNDEAQ